MDISCAHQAAGADLHVSLLEVITACRSAETRIGALEGDVSALQRELAQLQQDKEDLKFLSVYRDFIRTFRNMVSEMILGKYRRCRGGCRIYDAADYADEVEWPVTSSLQRELAGLQISWTEWGAMRSIADASIGAFHRGNNMSASAALSKLQKREMQIPASLASKEEALVKALTLLCNEEDKCAAERAKRKVAHRRHYSSNTTAAVSTRDHVSFNYIPDIALRAPAITCPAALISDARSLLCVNSGNDGGCSRYTILVTSDCAQPRPCLVLLLALAVLRSVQDAVATHCAVQADSTVIAN
eukprot:7304-Heterococcus_DN1.PRE.1